MVLAGYALSSAARPFIAVAQSWTQVFGIRFIDRVGKGARGAPRDAMLAGYATAGTRGRVYGFHRGMDHAGAVLGPALASAFLFFYPGEYRMLFGLTVIPGVVAVLLVLLLPEPAPADTRRDEPVFEPRDGQAVRFLGFPSSLRNFIVVLALFTLGNSTDAYLLLRLTDAAAGAALVPLMWAALHVVKAGVSFVAGDWSDRAGRRTVIGLGWMVYAAVYLGFALSASLEALLAWFLVYGFYFGFAEGTEKALIADLAPPTRRGFAFGVYTAVQGLGSLAASLLFGALWTLYGAVVAFSTGAILALLATAALFAFVPEPAQERGISAQV
jgi:MFS family permease